MRRVHIRYSNGEQRDLHLELDGPLCDVIEAAIELVPDECEIDELEAR